VRAVAAVVERDVTASGARLRVADSGSGSSVILLHGLFLDHTTWDGISRSLSEHHRVVAPDLPGFGASEKPPVSRFSYQVEAFAEAVADLYAALELGRAHVVGQCLGGAVALVLAARHPELVSKLVLVDALCETPRLGAFGQLGLLPLAGGFIFKQLWGKNVFRALLRERLSGPAGEDETRLDHHYAAFSEPAARVSALETLRAVQDLRPLVARTAGVRAPTLVVWGSGDRVVPVSAGKRLAREIPGARFELLGTGHAPQDEAPEALGAAVSRFLLE
jgi:pimeloyl-ACP methyl ester carboxylesterase